MPPPFFSAVSATTAPVTPGMAFTTRSAAARSGSSSFALSAGTVIEKKTFEVGDKDVRHQAEANNITLEVGPLDRLQLLDNGVFG